MKKLKKTKHLIGNEYPKDWDTTTLIEISTNGISNGVFNDPDKVGKGYRLINVLDLYNEPCIDTSKLMLLDIDEKEFLRSKVVEGDIFFTRSSLKLEGIAFCNICLEDAADITYDGHIMKVSPNKEIINPLFLRLYCISNCARKYFMKNAKQTTMTTIGQDDIAGLPIPLPSLQEQNTIAHVLSTWDEAITKTQTLITQKEQHKKWLMQNLLTGKKRLQGFGTEWKEYTYNNLLKIVKRPVEWNDEELYGLVSVRRRSGGIFLRESLYGHQIKVKNLRDVEEGDFLFSKMQILHGASALVTNEFAGAKISGSYICVIPNDFELLNMNFFNWYSQTPYFYHQTYISSYGVHIEKMTFDFKSFLALGMKLPSKEEQTAIAHLLEIADKEIQLLKIKMDKLKEQKKGLMQILLTGKKRLKMSNRESKE